MYELECIDTLLIKKQEYIFMSWGTLAHDQEVLMSKLGGLKGYV